MQGFGDAELGASALLGKDSKDSLGGSSPQHAVGLGDDGVIGV